MTRYLEMVKVTAACIYGGSVFSNTITCMARDYDREEFVRDVVKQRAMDGLDETGLTAVVTPSVKVERYQMEVWSDD